MTAPEPWVPDDDELLALLKEAISIARDCEALLPAAKATYTWLTVDAELEVLALLEDSAVTVTGVRGARDVNVLQFHGTSITVSLELQPGVILGQVQPAREGQTVTYLPATGQSYFTGTDASGGFVLVREDNGPFKLQFKDPQTSSVTDWIL